LPYRLVVALFYALHIVRRGPEQMQLRWFLMASDEIVDALDEEHPGFEVAASYWRSVEGAAAVLLVPHPLTPTVVADVWNRFDGLRAKVTDLVAAIERTRADED
jgi:hypothetical protein